VVPKNGIRQLIINMQLLNVAISPPCFKYKDLALLAPLLKEGDYMTMINLKDGFFHVPVLPSHQAYMSFQWEGKTYVFQVLPFGMSTLPWLFTCFVQATTGPPSFKVPPRKSHALHHNINCLLRLFRQQGQVPVQKLAAVIGQGVALTKAILPAKLLLRNAYHNIARRENWNSLVPLSAATILDLEDWLHGLSTWNGRLANLQPCNVLLDTDASLDGGHLWGQH